jgi:hypothetical protein
VALAFSLVACDSDKAQKVQPETRGKRGERCMARNDCDAGLACISGICAKNEFAIDVSTKHCERSECKTDTDCCGERLTEAPPECDDRVLICETPTLANCVQTTCTDANEATLCGDGFCGTGSCTQLGFTCMTTTDCHDVCGVDGVCTLSNVACTLDTQCTYNSYNATQACGNRLCNCANPDYAPSDPLCENEDCLNVCNLRCDDNELCVEDDSCEADLDCPATAPICEGSVCVQCTTNSECNPDNDEVCENGFCRRDCEFNEECGIFEECQAGDCVYVGCTSNLACILAAGRVQGGVGGSGNVSVGSGDDARLYECLESEVDSSIGVCRVPCENDGNCTQLEVCEEGYCKFVGCVDHEDCRIYFGIANQVVTENKPYVTSAICTDEPRQSDSVNAN